MLKKHMQVNHKYTKYSIEEFVHLIVQKELKKEELVSKIKNTNADKESISKTLQKVDFAYKRIDEPLENDIKYLLLIFPYGIVNRFNLRGSFDATENKRLGFVRKIKEYNKYSFIGLILYAIIIILAIILFQINKIA